eukprot:UN03469
MSRPTKKENLNHLPIQANELIVVAVGDVTNDSRILTVPKGLKLCCLRVSESARKRIIQQGGEILTFDQLALREPLGKNTILLRGPLKARAAYD